MLLMIKKKIVSASNIVIYPGFVNLSMIDLKGKIK